MGNTDINLFGVGGVTNLELDPGFGLTDINGTDNSLSCSSSSNTLYLGTSSTNIQKGDGGGGGGGGGGGVGKGYGGDGGGVEAREGRFILPEPSLLCSEYGFDSGGSSSSISSATSLIELDEPLDNPPPPLSLQQASGGGMVDFGIGNEDYCLLGDDTEAMLFNNSSCFSLEPLTEKSLLESL